MPRNTTRQGQSQGHSARAAVTPAWWAGAPVRISIATATALCESVGLDRRTAQAKALVRAVAETLGEHLEMAEALATAPRPSTQRERVREALAHADALCASLRETGGLIEPTAELDATLRLLRSRLVHAERALCSESRGAPPKHARDLTLRALAGVYRQFAADGERGELIEFLREACKAARDRHGKISPIRLPKRGDDLIAIVHPE